MKIRIKIKHEQTHGILFMHESENNTIKTTVETAVKLKVNLDDAHLWGIDLEGANLKEANLRGANLEGVNLKGANLEWANLGEANLWNANLKGANLKVSSLWNANLEVANLEEANLERASLWNANLEGANLEGANLEGASLWSVNLEGANLNVKIPPLDRTFISEILRREAKEDNEMAFSARILRENRCWEYFYKLAQKEKILGWAEKVLNQWEVYQKKLESIRG